MTRRYSPATEPRARPHRQPAFIARESPLKYGERLHNGSEVLFDVQPPPFDRYCELLRGLASEAGLFNAQYMTRMARIALMPPKAMRCRPSETL